MCYDRTNGYAAAERRDNRIMTTHNKIIGKKSNGGNSMEWTKTYKKAITFSYDDGVEMDLQLLELLNKYGLKATFNLNTGLDGTNDSWRFKGVEVKRLNLQQYAGAYKGHEIAVHTLTHPNICELSEKDLEREVLGDRENIQKLFGQHAVGFAYPYGAYSEEVIKKLSNYGFLYARGVEPSHSFEVQSELLTFRPTCHHDDENLFDLAAQFLKIEPEQPQIFYIWGHSYEFEGNHNWDRFEELCKLISGKQDIFYGTNTEVLI